MGKPRKVKFEISPATSKAVQHFGHLKVGGEIVFSGELQSNKSQLVRTMKNMVKKIQAGLVEIVELDASNNVVKKHL